MLEYIRDVVKPDVIIWTGDSISHDFWEHTHEEVIRKITVISDLVFQYLNKTSTIYPVMGNHDVFPLNMQSFDEASKNL